MCDEMYIRIVCANRARYGSSRDSQIIHTRVLFSKKCWKYKERKKERKKKTKKEGQKNQNRICCLLKKKEKDWRFKCKLGNFDQSA